MSPQATATGRERSLVAWGLGWIGGLVALALLVAAFVGGGLYTATATSCCAFVVNRLTGEVRLCGAAGCRVLETTALAVPQSHEMSAAPAARSPPSWQDAPIVAPASQR